MMYFLGGLENAVLQTLLAERIRLNLPVTDTLPRSAVGVLIIGTLVSVVEALRLCLVLWAILFSRRGEAGAAGVAAGPLGTGGHLRSPPIDSVSQSVKQNVPELLNICGTSIWH